MANAEDIANLTRHQNVTDAMLTSMGEYIAIQQALLNVPSFDGKNMPLKSYIQDIESALTLVPEVSKDAFFKGVIAKLRDSARDAIIDKDINSIETLTKALKEYFSSKKTYCHYCAEIQSARLRQNETEYFTRIRKLRNDAISSLKEKFNAEQVEVMKNMLDGLALESFKRGLSDDLLYAVSVDDPQTIEEALKLVQRIERDLQTSSNKNSNYLRIAQQSDNTYNPFNDKSPRTVSFEDDERRNTIPFFLNRNDMYRPRNYDNRSFRRDSTPPRDQRNNYQDRNYSYTRNRSPARPNPYYYPPIPYPYPYPPGFYPSFPMHTYPGHNNNNNNFNRSNSPSSRPNSPVIQSNIANNPLNSQSTRREDAPTSLSTEAMRPATVKFMTIEDMLDG